MSLKTRTHLTEYTYPLTAIWKLWSV